MVVDPYGAGDQFPRDASGPAADWCPGGGGQPERDVVGQRQALVVGGEGQGDEHRAEHLLLDDLAALVGADQQGRLVVGAVGEVAGGRTPPGHHPRAVGDRPVDHPGDPVPLPEGGQGALVGGGVGGGPSRTDAIRSATPAMKASNSDAGRTPARPQCSPARC